MWRPRIQLVILCITGDHWRPVESFSTDTQAMAQLAAEEDLADELSRALDAARWVCLKVEYPPKT